MMNLQHFIGIDISAVTLDVCVLSDNQVILEVKIKNDLKAIRKFLKGLSAKGITNENSFTCAEHTGAYGINLRLILEGLDMVYFMVPSIEIKRSIGFTRGKSDRVDARRIADYCVRFLDRMSPSKLPAKYLKDLKDLFSYREILVKSRVSRKNQLKNYQISKPSGPRDFIIKDIEKQIGAADKMIKVLEQKILKVISSDAAAKKNYELIKSVNGIGPITASYLIIVTENFTLFADARKFASYAGIAPFEHTSGTSVRGKTKTSKFRNKQAKALLITGVNSVIRGNGEMAVYYKRKIEEGKHKNSVKNAIAFKLLGRIFAVVKRQSPYIQTYANVMAA